MTRLDQQFRIAEIDVAKNQSDEKIAGIFRFEQSGNGGKGPTLLVIADIQSALYAYERLLDLINSTAEQARLMMAGVAQDPVARFEKLVQRINEAVASFEEQEASPLNWQRINLFLIELSEGHMCFSGAGTLMNVFLQKQEDGSYRAFDIFGSLEQAQIPDPKKPFSSIVCGDMKPGDVLIAGTNNLERLRTELQMKERLTTLPPITAALEIRNDLEKRNIPDHFAAAVIACQELKRPEVVAPIAAILEPKDKSTASIEKLRGNEQEAKHHLAPAIPPVVKMAPANLAATLRQSVTNLREKIVNKTQTVKSTIDPMAMASLRGMSAGYGNFFTKQRKLVIWGSVSLVVLLIAGGLWWRHAQQVAAETALWNASFDSANDQRNRAEADLTFNNDSRAQAEIETSEQQLSSLPTNTKDRSDRIAKLKSDLAGLKNQLKKIVNVENVTNLTALAASAQVGQLTAPVLVGDTAYVADNSTQSILKLSISTKDVTPILLPKDFGPIVSGTEAKDSILFATHDGKLVSIKKSDDSLKTLTWQQTKTSSTTAIVFYGSKLYSLDAASGQIWRSTASGNGFGAESAYVKATSIPLNNAASLAIDSSVFVLTNDGTVVRFLSGGQEGFALNPVDPPIRAASGIWTGIDSQQLLITDPADKRILIFDKAGQLKSQITSSQIKAPSGVSVDEANKRIIITDSNRLLLVPMP